MTKILSSRFLSWTISIGDNSFEFHIFFNLNVQLVIYVEFPYQLMNDSFKNGPE